MTEVTRPASNNQLLLLGVLCDSALLYYLVCDDADYKSRIVQRGGVPPLIRMLSANDVALKEMAAFALGRLAQNTHNQAGIVQVRTLSSTCGSTWKCAAGSARMLHWLKSLPVVR